MVLCLAGETGVSEPAKSAGCISISDGEEPGEIGATCREGCTVDLEWFSSLYPIVQGASSFQ